MNHKPPYKVSASGVNKFTCPECKQIWVLAGVGPGNYWEPLEKNQSEKTFAETIINDFKNQGIV